MKRKDFIIILCVIFLIPFIGICKFVGYTKDHLNKEAFEKFVNQMLNATLNSSQMLYCNEKVYKILKVFTRKK
jgi:uncharacterized membrane protein (DUF485 family)